MSLERTLLLRVGVRAYVTESRARGDSDQAIVAALLYELTSLLGKASAYPESAHRAIDAWAVSMHQQVDRFGVRKDHP